MNLPLLYPTPRTCDRRSGTVAIPATRTISGVRDPAVVANGALKGLVVAATGWIQVTYEATVGDGPEDYRLELTSAGCAITARGDAGVRHALATLAQLLAESPATLPALSISDGPKFSHRGVMLDISRDRVPTMATLRDLVDRLAALKYNRLQLYVEHTVAYPGHEVVWRNADPMTLDELAELGAYAGARGIALDANQNCLGHWERWLRVPAYADLGEISRGVMHRGSWYVDPTTLYPAEPRAFALVSELVRHQAKVCPGEFVNIGCDEPWELGTGRSKVRCDEVGIKTVFSEWVSRVAKVVTATGKRPQFWCDPEPREGNDLPSDLIALVWGYDPKTDFANRALPHREAGRAVWVCPGTNCWNSITGRTSWRQGNLLRARDEGIAVGAEGYLCTEWGDNGHRQPWPTTLHAFADGAQAAWGHGAFDAAAAGQSQFGSPALGQWLHALGDVGADIGHNALFADAGLNLLDPSGQGDVAAWRSVCEQLDDLAARMPSSDPLVQRECRHAITTAQWIARRAVVRRSNPTVEDRRALATTMVDIVAEHRATWLARSRYGGLEDSCVHYKRHLWWY